MEAQVVASAKKRKNWSAADLAAKCTTKKQAAARTRVLQDMVKKQKWIRDHKAKRIKDKAQLMIDKHMREMQLLFNEWLA